MKLLKELLNESTADSDILWYFETGRDEGNPRKFTGTAEAVCSRILNTFVRDLRYSGPEEVAEFKRERSIYEKIKNPKDLFDALVALGTAWDGYNLDVGTMAKPIEVPPGMVKRSTLVYMDDADESTMDDIQRNAKKAARKYNSKSQVELVPHPNGWGADPVKVTFVGTPDDAKKAVQEFKKFTRNS